MNEMEMLKKALEELGATLEEIKVKIDDAKSSDTDYVKLSIGKLSVTKESLEGLKEQLEDCATRKPEGCRVCPVGPGNGCVNKLLLHASAAMGHLIEKNWNEGETEKPSKED